MRNLSRITSAILLLFLGHYADAYRITNFSTFGFVNSLSKLNDRLVIATDGGVVVYSPLMHSVTATFVTENEVYLAVPDPLSPDIYFVEGRHLKRWSPPFKNANDIVELPDVPKSLGIDRDWLYVEFNNSVKKFNKIGILVAENSSPPPDVLWCGKKGSISRDDPLLMPLQPLLVNSPTMGLVRMSFFYREMDKLWVGTEGLGVYVFSTSTWQKMDSINVGIYPKDVRAIHIRNGEMWIGGTDGISVRRRENWTPFKPEGMMVTPGFVVTSIDGDSQFIWFGTDRGVIRYNRKNRNFWRFTASVPSSYIRTVRDWDGVVWMCTDDGAYYLSGSTPVSEVVRGVGINDVLKGKHRFYLLTERGVYWIGIDEVFGNKSDDKGFALMEDPKGWLGFEVYAGASSLGKLYFVAKDGLVIYDEVRDTFSYSELPVVPDKQPIAKCVVKNGCIFLATNSGLWMAGLQDLHWRVLTAIDGLASDRVLSIAVKDDTLWVGTDRGLSVVIGW